MTVQCSVLGVSASGYFERQARQAKPASADRHLNDEALLAHIRAAHAASKGEYGWPRIWRELRHGCVRAG